MSDPVLDRVRTLRVIELRDELRSRGLPTHGLKAELVARLTAAINTSAARHTVVSNLETEQSSEDQNNQTTPCQWGHMRSIREVSDLLQACYSEIIKWRKNVFMVPRGSVGKEFIAELTRLIQLYNRNAIWKPVAIKALHVFMVFMLQKPTKTSKAKDHTKYLRSRMHLWKDGDLQALLSQCKEIQKRMMTSRNKKKEVELKRFTRLMLLGKLGQAANVINRSSGGLLEINEEVRRKLEEKHPDAKPLEEALAGPEMKVEEVVFDHIDGDMVKKSRNPNTWIWRTDAN